MNQGKVLNDSYMGGDSFYDIKEFGFYTRKEEKERIEEIKEKNNEKFKTLLKNKLRKFLI